MKSARKRVFLNMDKRDREIISAFKQRLIKEALMKNIKKLIIFGSRAKGQATEESDLDMIALVTNKTPDIEKKLEDVAYCIMWDYDFKPIISLKVFDESRFNDAVAKGFPFYKHAGKEGVYV